jgi:hypothetical protein
VGYVPEFVKMRDRFTRSLYETAAALLTESQLRRARANVLAKGMERVEAEARNVCHKGSHHVFSFSFFFVARLVWSDSGRLARSGPYRAR